MTITLDTNLLLSYFQARNGLVGGSGAGVGATGSGGTKKYAPTAPWSSSSTAAKVPDLVKSALLGRHLINENAAQLDLPGASEDYRKLFALYQGLSALDGIAEQASNKRVAALDLARMQKVFGRGLAEVSAYVDEAKLDQIRITRGQVGTSSKATIGVPRNNYEYVTDPLYVGKPGDTVPAFQGAAQFDVQVKKLAGTFTVHMDLAEMGSTPRTMSSVVNYFNSKLQAAGLITRFAVDRTPGEEREVKSSDGKTTVKLPPLGDSYAIRVKGDLAEQLTFAAVTKPAVYVTTYAGDPDPDKDAKTDDGAFESRLIKIDPNAATPTQSRVKTDTLEGTIQQVRTTRVGADGSVYMLADVEKSVAGQDIKGETDVALLKYDSAGNVLYARTLGAAEKASGLALSVAADGQVAIAGSVTGLLDGSTNGPVNSGDKSDKSDSFVTLFDAKGDEVWTMRRGSGDLDEATAVTIGDDGVVYVAGRVKGAMPNGGGVSGGWDGYVAAYTTGSTGTPKTLFTQQFGTATDDKPAGIVLNGDQLVVASNEGGSGILRSFDVSRSEVRTTDVTSAGVLTRTVETYVDGVLTNTQQNVYSSPTAPDGTSTKSYTSAATATASATRDIGSLQGGQIAGLELDGGDLWIAGQTRNAALGVGNVTAGHAGGMDAFAARLSTDLADNSQDALAYYGGAGDNTVAGMSVAGGKVWVAGSAGADLPGLTASGKSEGYVAGIDVAAGTVSGAQRISGKDQIATATSVAIDPNGGSDLDIFGLPMGKLDYTRSQKIVSATSARAGDQFQIQTRNGGAPVTVTLSADDTLETLAATIRRKGGYNVKVEIVSGGGGRVLKISPARDAAVVEIIPGKGGKDLLDALGLTEGIVRRTEINDLGKTVSLAPGGEAYGLDLDLDLDLDSAEDISHARAVLQAAMGKIRTAYKDLENAAKPASLQQQSSAASGPVPAYLQAQIANYQAGLARLTGGG